MQNLSQFNTELICTFAKSEIDKMPKVQSSEGELWGLLSAQTDCLCL